MVELSLPVEPGSGTRVAGGRTAMDTRRTGRGLWLVIVMVLCFRARQLLRMVVPCRDRLIVFSRLGTVLLARHPTPNVLAGFLCPHCSCFASRRLALHCFCFCFRFAFSFFFCLTYIILRALAPESEDLRPCTREAFKARCSRQCFG